MPRDTNALWVSLSGYGEGNIFHVYPKILEELLKKEDEERVEGDTTAAEQLVLPSNPEWRIKQYYKLVALQKTLQLEKLVWVEDGEQVGVNKAIVPRRETSVEQWLPWNIAVEYKNPRAPPPVRVAPGTETPWDISKVLLAAKLLSKPPVKVDFQDEQEMRCVYSLIYDVFRYKTILDEVIWTTDFFAKYPQFTDYPQLTWLFLMELARRRWDARPRSEVRRADALLESAGSPYFELEQAIWDQRVHFAAAVSKIRIKQKAFLMSELLPPHLREERVSACVNKETVTGWVNTFKERKVAAVVKRLNECGYTYSSSRQLCAGEYNFDRVCPRFMTIYPRPNTSIGKLDLVREHVIVLQEREFCEGASTLCRALRMHNLTGVIAQTHTNSPRCTAYLAAQLRELAAVMRNQMPPAPVIPELGRLVVFSAGDGAKDYIMALKDLGIEASTNISDNCVVTIIPDSIHADTPTVNQALDGVVAVIATPPNSYSAVTDPIDLVCGRGGDLTMLEILTESEVDSVGKSRVGMILEEQRKTLKALLTKPQIQLVLYETHSALDAENQAQVIRAVSDANRLAKENHMLNKKGTTTKTNEDIILDISANPLEEEENDDKNDEDESSQKGDTDDLLSSPLRKKRHDNDTSILKKEVDAGEKTPKSETTKARPIPDMPQSENITADFAEIIVPKCDLFQITNLPNLSNGLDINYILCRDGVYLSLIQRKEFTRMDAKYMIKVAEERGLFGNNPGGQVRRKRREQDSAPAPRRRRKPSGFEVLNVLKRREKLVERIAAPTHASMQRSTSARRGSAPSGMEGCECERHLRRQAAAHSYTGACTCDIKHRHKVVLNKVMHVRCPRGTSPEPRTTTLPCREPFPVTVQELCLNNLDTKYFTKPYTATTNAVSTCNTGTSTYTGEVLWCASPNTKSAMETGESVDTLRSSVIYSYVKSGQCFTKTTPANEERLKRSKRFHESLTWLL